MLTLAPKRLHGMGIAIGDDVTVELAPEGPQRGDLADDIAAALAADPAAGAFFDTLAQFYRKAYLRWIDATTRRPDVRAARIAEVAACSRRGSRSGHDREGSSAQWIIGDRSLVTTRWAACTGRDQRFTAHPLIQVSPSARRHPQMGQRMEQEPQAVCVDQDRRPDPGNSRRLLLAN